MNFILLAISKTKKVYRRLQTSHRNFLSSSVASEENIIKLSFYISSD